MYLSTTKLRVRYAETDKMGFVYYGNYATYYEVGRVECMRGLGIEYAKMENELLIAMPVVELNIKFIKAAFYDDELTIETIVTALPTKFIDFKAKVYNSKSELLNEGSVRLLFWDLQTKKIVHCPSIIVEKLQSYFE